MRHPPPLPLPLCRRSWVGARGGLNRPAPRAQNTPFCVSSIDVPCAVRGNFAVDTGMVNHRYDAADGAGLIKTPTAARLHALNLVGMKTLGAC
jgi:hypothetical protein